MLILDFQTAKRFKAPGFILSWNLPQAPILGTLIRYRVNAGTLTHAPLHEMPRGFLPAPALD
jgi:hypothetical protein